MSNVVGQIPEFDPNGSLMQGEQGIEEPKETVVEETTDGTDTQAELPADPDEGEKPTADSGEDTEQQPNAGQDFNKALAKATEGLRNEIVGLKQQIAGLRGNDRELAQKQLIVAQNNLDELKDVNPEDVSLIEKVLKSKGYMTKEEALTANYETVQKQVLTQFLTKYPEYKPENDPDNTNWNRLIGEYGLYARPSDPYQIMNLLEKSHKVTTPVASGRNITIQKQVVKTASLGSGGKGRSSSGVTQTLSPEQRRIYQDGGWSEEEISEIEKSL